MEELIHKNGIACSPGEVFDALTTDEGLSRWWTTDTSGAGEVDLYSEGMNASVAHIVGTYSIPPKRAR